MSAEQIWNDVRAQRERPVFKRVDEKHPCDLYLGVDVNELPVLMLLSSRSVEQLPRLKSLEVSQNLRQDGKFAVLISLSTADLLHPFCYRQLWSLQVVPSAAFRLLEVVAKAVFGVW